MDKFNQSQEIDVKNKGLIEKILDIIKNKFTNVDDSINNINEKIAEIKSKSASLSKIENIEIENMDVSPIDSINKGSSLSSVDPSQIHYIKPSFNSSQIPLPDSPESSINYIKELQEKDDLVEEINKNNEDINEYLSDHLDWFNKSKDKFDKFNEDTANELAKDSNRNKKGYDI